SPPRYKWWRKEFQRQEAPTNARESLISIRQSRTKFTRCFTSGKRQPRRCTIFSSATKKRNNFSDVCSRERFSESGKLQTSSADHRTAKRWTVVGRFARSPR